jgi:S-adenosylmethionine-diacylglycerol 3-amino-3-carboxypropyl transferase
MNEGANIPRVDFSFVRYANCWEDAAILVKALRPEKGMRLLSIASAGDNSLALIASGAEVVAVDLNPSQLACAELRREAIRIMPYGEFLQFIGVDESDSRLDSYDAVRPHLTPSALAFWDSRRDIIEQGFIHFGKFERYFRLFRKRILPLIHSRHRVEALLSPMRMDERREFYRRRWDSVRWNLLFRVFFSRIVMGRLGRDPVFFQQVKGSVADRILSRARYALSELDASANPYLTYILTGNYRPALPFYLRQEYYQAIRNNIQGLVLQPGSVDEVAASHGPKAFDGFNLSDIFEYLTPSACAGVYEKLLSSARPGARLAYWNMLVPRACPPNLLNRVRCLEDEADGLFMQDQAFFYSRFVVEEVM